MQGFRAYDDTTAVLVGTFRQGLKHVYTETNEKQEQGGEWPGRVSICSFRLSEQRLMVTDRINKSIKFFL
jgi:hypothetical protein